MKEIKFHKTESKQVFFEKISTLSIIPDRTGGDLIYRESENTFYYANGIDSSGDRQEELYVSSDGGNTFTEIISPSTNNSAENMVDFNGDLYFISFYDGDLDKYDATTGSYTGVSFGIYSGETFQAKLFEYNSKLYLFCYNELFGGGATSKIYESSNATSWSKISDQAFTDNWNFSDIVVKEDAVYFVGGYNSTDETITTTVFRTTDMINFTEFSSTTQNIYGSSYADFQDNFLYLNKVNYTENLFSCGGLLNFNGGRQFSNKVILSEDMINFYEIQLPDNFKVWAGATCKSGADYYLIGGYADVTGTTYTNGFYKISIKNISPSVNYNPDVSETANNRLLFQYKNSPNLQAILDSYVSNPVQKLEDMFYQFYKLFDIDLSTGDQLDNIGRILNQPRESRTDEIYRIILKGAIGANSSEGSTEEVYSVWKILSRGNTLRINRIAPALIEFYTDVDIPADLVTTIFELMEKAISAGVQIYGINYFRPAGYFGWSDDPTAEGFDVGLFDFNIINN